MRRARLQRGDARAGRTVDVCVPRIGARGDGIADGPAGRLYIPYAAPGDRLRVRIGAARGDGHAARIDAILQPAQVRQQPVCRHFGACGGCALQHLRDDAVAALKRSLLLQALVRKGLDDATVAETISVAAATRRRIRLTYRRGHSTTLGFNRRGSRRVLDIAECPVVLPEIARLLGPLHEFCGTVDALGATGDIQVTATDTGIDLLPIPSRPADPDLAAREAAAAFADRHDLSRIAWQVGRDWEPIAERRPAVVGFAGIPVVIPPTAFLQASKAGEDAIVDIITRAFAAANPARIADLYAGCGALSVPAARIAPVFAVDGDPAMTAALAAAASGRNIGVATRDLQKDPFPAAALAEFDAVIFDPPRAGAHGTAEALAGSAVPLVVAVSCNPATLARDLRILVDGGYAIECITPIDQFKWSAHVEAVAVLRR